jgi:hypothetical protein
MQGDRDWPADTPLKVLNLNKKNRQAALWSLYPAAGSVNGRCRNRARLMIKKNEPFPAH